MLQMANYYGCPEEKIEDRYWLKLDKVLKATTDVEARDFARKAWDGLFICLLVMWGKKQIPGPPTAENLGRKAKQAESLAKFQHERGNDAAAEKLKAKAAAIRAQLVESGGRDVSPPWRDLPF